MRILVTGGAGFIGCNFIRYMLRRHGGDQIVNLDALTYAGNLSSLADMEKESRYSFVKADIIDPDAVAQVMTGVEAVVNFAAETHVDRSIEGPAAFVTTNVMGTQVLLDAARKAGVKRFVQISTDEVYGSLGPEGLFSELTPLSPNSPYAASKAGADLLVSAYHATYGLDTVITRCSNNYGPYQFPEKLVPLMITNALQGVSLPVYGDGLHVRDWIFVEDHCRGVDAALRLGRPGAVYNFGGASEMANIAIVKEILRRLDVSEDLISHVEDRLGHDRRYAMDFSLAEKELGWRPQVSFETGLGLTLDWYLANRKWWEDIRSGDYKEYYQRMYGSRAGID